MRTRPLFEHRHFVRIAGIVADMPHCDDGACSATSHPCPRCAALDALANMIDDLRARNAELVAALRELLKSHDNLYRVAFLHDNLYRVAFQGLVDPDGNALVHPTGDIAAKAARAALAKAEEP